MAYNFDQYKSLSSTEFSKSDEFISARKAYQEYKKKLSWLSWDTTEILGNHQGNIRLILNDPNVCFELFSAGKLSRSPPLPFFL